MEIIECILLTLILFAEIWKIFAVLPGEKDKPEDSNRVPDNMERRFTEGVMNVLSYDLEAARRNTET